MIVSTDEEMIHAEKEAGRDVPLTLLVVAFLPLILGFIGAAQHPSMPTWLTIMTLEAGVLVGLAVWGRLHPYPASLAALIVSIAVTLLMWLAVLAPTELPIVLIRFFFVALVARALAIAYHYEKLKQG